MHHVISSGFLANSFLARLFGLYHLHPIISSLAFGTKIASFPPPPPPQGLIRSVPFIFLALGFIYSFHHLAQLRPLFFREAPWALSIQHRFALSSNCRSLFWTTDHPDHPVESWQVMESPGYQGQGQY